MTWNDIIISIRLEYLKHNEQFGYQFLEHLYYIKNSKETNARDRWILPKEFVTEQTIYRCTF